MDQLQNPNIAGNFQQGYAFGNQVKQQREQEQNRNALRELAPGIIDGELDALTQGAAIDPAAASQYNAVGVDIAKRGAGAATYILDAVKRGNPQEIEGRYQAVLPFLTKVGAAQGKVPPPNFDPAMIPLMEQLVAKSQAMGGGALGRVQSTYVDGEGNRVAIMADGSQKVLGANDAGMSQQTISIPGPDGRPRQFTFDKRTGNYVPAGEGGGAPAAQTAPAATVAGATTFRTSNGELFDVSQVEDPAMQADILARPTEYGLLSDAGGGSVELPQRDVSPGAQLQTKQAVAPGPSAFVGRSPEEEAAAVARAKGGVELDLLPKTLELQTQAGVAEAAQKAEAEARVKREADLATAAQKKYVDASTTLSLLDEAEKLLSASTGSLVGSARDAVYGAVGASTPGAQAIAQLQPIAASLTLAVPRMEGPQSDADRLLYQKAAGDFANPNVPSETRQAALAQMRRLAQRYTDNGGRPPAAPSSGNPVRVSSAEDYNALPSGATFLAPDGTTRRKR